MLARLFIRALLVLMRVAVLESVFLPVLAAVMSYGDWVFLRVACSANTIPLYFLQIQPMK